MHYEIHVNPPQIELSGIMIRTIWKQLQKELFFAVRAYEVSISQLKLTRGKLSMRATGKFRAVNDFITFVLLRLSEKTQQVLYRSYRLLKVEGKRCYKFVQLTE